MQNENDTQTFSLLAPKSNLVMGNVFKGFSSGEPLGVTSFSQSEGLQFVQANPSNEGNMDGVQVVPSLTSEEGDIDPSVTIITPPQVAREIEVLELPFLVTAPPVPEIETEDTAPINHAVRQRSSVNPFSPMVVAKAPPPAPSRSVPPTSSTTTSRLATSPAPSVATTRAVADRSTSRQLRPDVVPPTPRPTAPPSAQASLGSMPQALSKGTLPVAPTLLSRPTRSVMVATSEPSNLRASTAPPPDVDITQIVGVRTPSAAPLSTTTVTSSTSSIPVSNQSNVTAQATTNRELDVVASTEQIEEAIPAPIGMSTALSRNFRQSQPKPSTVMPGITALSRYLRDANLRFTGAVLGPVNLAVFRANGQAFSVQLGQNLPDTDIVLTSVKDHEIELTQGNESKFLTLDLRR